MHEHLYICCYIYFVGHLLIFMSLIGESYRLLDQVRYRKWQSAAAAAEQKELAIHI